MSTDTVKAMFDRREAALVQELAEVRNARETYLRLSRSGPRTKAKKKEIVSDATATAVSYLPGHFNCRSGLVHLLRDHPAGLAKKDIREGLKRLGVNVSDNTLGWTLCEYPEQFQSVKRGVWKLAPAA